jgi:hypothetical protein
LATSQSSADPPFVEDRPPGKIPEETFRDPDPPPKGVGKIREVTTLEMNRPNLKTFRTLLEPFREKWPGADSPGVLTVPQSSADPPFVEDRPPGKIPEKAYRNPDPSP